MDASDGNPEPSVTTGQASSDSGWTRTGVSLFLAWWVIAFAMPAFQARAVFMAPASLAVIAFCFVRLLPRRVLDGRIADVMGFRPRAAFQSAAQHDPLEVGTVEISRAAVLPMSVVFIVTWAVMAWQTFDVARSLGALGVWGSIVVFLPNPVRIFDADEIRWRRTLWSRERRVAVADIERVEERFLGNLILIGRGDRGRPVGPRIRMGALSHSEAAAVRRWIGARFAVRGPGGDRVGWARPSP